MPFFAADGHRVGEEVKFNAFVDGRINFFLIGRGFVAGATVDNVYLARGNTACRSATVHGHIAATDDDHFAFERRRFPFG